MDGVQQDLERLEVTYWEERIQDRDYWRPVTVAANGVVKAHKKKKNYIKLILIIILIR
jgi:hypothetical protein